MLLMLNPMRKSYLPNENGSVDLCFLHACGRTGYTGPTGRTGPRHDPPDPSAYSTHTSLAQLASLLPEVILASSIVVSNYHLLVFRSLLYPDYNSAIRPTFLSPSTLSVHLLPLSPSTRPKLLDKTS